MISVFLNMVIVQFAELPEGNDEDNTKNKALQSYDDNDHVLPQWQCEGQYSDDVKYC